MVIEVLYKSFRYEKFDSSAQTNSEPFRAKGTNILTDWNLYLGALEENGIILAEHWYDGNPQHAGGHQGSRRHPSGRERHAPRLAR